MSEAPRKILTIEVVNTILDDFNNGVPLKKLSDSIGCCDETLKRSLVYHCAWKDRSLPQCTKGYKPKGRKGVLSVSILIRDQYRRDAAELKKTDDNLHWSKHRVVVNHMSYLAKKRCPMRTIKASLRVRLWKFTHGGWKSAPTMKLVGCSEIKLKRHIESKFADGMSWDNYGTKVYNGWELDHIIPCTAFNLLAPEDQRRCFHYSNLQPLWKSDNIRKGGFKMWRKSYQSSHSRPSSWRSRHS